MDRLRLAIGQMCSADTHAANIKTVTSLAMNAVGQGAQVLALPEVAGLMNANRKVAVTQVVDAADDPFIAACQEIAAKNSLWIHTGSTPVKAPDGRFLNHTTLIDAEGAIKAEYDKVHLFDVQIEGEAPIGESKRYAPGEVSVITDTPWGGFGLTICYDLRFAHLYRALGQAGANIIFIPSAFTIPTGRAHWEVLLRARAIESGAFVIASAQSGSHSDGRETYGHSLAVDPWGHVLADMGEGAPKLGLVDLDLALVVKARAQIPALSNSRDVPLIRV